MIGRMNRALVLGALLVATSAATASAQGFGINQGGYGLGFFNYNGGYGINDPMIPYFSLYPPVYYSYPVARPYGWSPFAYPPGTMTPEAKPAPTAMYRNPYVQPTNTADAELTASRGAKTYYNPYVAQGRALARAGK